MKITVYHGSYTEVINPLVNIGRRNLEFGQGFYMYNSKNDAESWAEIVANHKGNDSKPMVNVYNFDYFRTKNIGYRFNEFETYNIEWLNFIVDCRKGKDVFSDYDIVIAGSIDEEIINIVEDYEKGFITAEQAISQLRYKDVNHQICIINQEIIDYCLEFVESYTL